MTKFSPEFLSLADDCLRQFAMIGNDAPVSDFYPSRSQRLPGQLSGLQLLCKSGNNLDNASPEAYPWHQRRVLITDSSALLMPDTEKNQNEYTQPSTQKKDLVSLFSESLF